MGRKFTPFEADLYLRTGEVLHYLWDPIGISDLPEARDEYDYYLPHVFGMLIRGESEDAVAQYLVSVETDRMGVWPGKDRARKVAEILTAWIDALKDVHGPKSVSDRGRDDD